MLLIIFNHLHVEDNTNKNLVVSVKIFSDNRVSPNTRFRPTDICELDLRRDGQVSNK